MSIKHRFVSGKTDGADATLVRASNWNDVHGGSVDVLCLSVYSVTGSYTVQLHVSGNCVVLAQASGVSGILTLPPASGAALPAVGNNQVAGYRVTILNKGQTGFILVQVTGEDKINLLNTTYELPNFTQFVTLISDGGPPYGGSGWWVVGQN